MTKREMQALTYVYNNPEKLSLLNINLFTGDRVDLFNGISACFNEYGYVTPEALEQFTTPKEELFTIPVEQIEPIIKDLQVERNRRKLKETADKLMMLADSDEPNLTEAQNIIFADSEYQAVSLSHAGMQFLEDLEAKRTGVYEFKSTGFKTLDVMLRGEWPKKEVSIISALPGVSKTALVGCSMLEMGKQGTASLLFSLEMHSTQLMARWIANQAHLDATKMGLGKIDAEDVVKATKAANYIASLPMYVIDDPNVTVNEIAATVRSYVKKHDIRVVFIDHLQILNVESSNRNAELGLAAKLFKNIAKALDIHICIVSQVNTVGGIRDSGDVQQNVDIRILVTTEDTGNTRQMNLNFEKNRNGKLGMLPMVFFANYLQYADTDD